MIEDKNIFYDVFRVYGTWLHRLCYRHYTVEGRENIPTDGAIILAPNHSNALQDAMSLAHAIQRPLVFVGQAAMFKNPFVAFFCRLFKILPIHRMRDGIGELRKNTDNTMSEAIRVLGTGTPFAIFPEGTMRCMHGVMPLVKGIFRIALDASEQLKTTNDKREEVAKRVYILPIGIDYDDYFHFGDDVSVKIGEAICVNDFAEEHPEMERPKLMLALRDELATRIKGLIRCIPTSPEANVVKGTKRDMVYEEEWKKLTGETTIPLKGGLPGVDDHGFDRTFLYLPIFVLGVFSLGILPFFILPFVHLAAAIRRMYGYKHRYQPLR